MKPDDVRANLEARLAELQASIARLDRETTQPLDPDFAEQANELEDLQANESLEALHVAEVEQVRAALARIDAGTWGVCAGCGEPIAPGRLQAMPTATHCIRCAA